MDDDTRNLLTHYAIEMLYDQMFDIIKRNLSKLEESDRYYNWYHGYTKIQLPYYYSSFSDGHVVYIVSTTATFGSISTQYNHEKFDAEKVETSFAYLVHVYPPARVINNTNITLHFDVGKILLKDLTQGMDRLNVEWRSKNYTPPTKDRYDIQHLRNVVWADVKKQKLDLMPGVRITWHYSGMEVKPDSKYYNEDSTRTKAFIRKCFAVILRF